jgi:hypothetical protein
MPFLLLHRPLQLACSSQPAAAPCRSSLPRHRHPMSTRLAGFVIPGDSADGARTTIALTTGTMGIDMTTTSLATIALIAGTATMTVQITGAAGTTAGTTTTIDEYGGCQKSRRFAPAASPSHRPSLLIKPGLLG